MDRSQLLDAIVESAPDALLAVDAGGRIVLANAQAERLFGAERSRLVGSSVELLVPHSARSVHPVMRRRYLDHPVPRPMGMGVELAARRLDGTEFPAEISLAPVSTQEGRVVVAAVRDVTERLAARAEHEELRARSEREAVEHRLRQTERLESLGQLAGGVAHDFNNILGAILNFAAFVDADLAGLPGPSGPVEALREDVRQIRLAAERGAELTRQLLAFGRRDVARPQVVDLDEVVARVRAMLGRTVGEHVEWTTRPSSTPATVLIDPGQMEQAVVNLALNARDAMPGGGRLALETEVLGLHDHAGPSSGTGSDEHARPVAGTVVLRVIDTGEGMPADVVSRAVEPFFTTKPDGQGTGLGLATVYGIVTSAGGSIAIRSAVGSGTTVEVTLPLVDAEVARADGGAGPSAGPPGRGTVLVVEDEPALREVARRVLERAGYQVVVAPDGDAAVALVQSSPVSVDLLLSDVVMPRLSGPEVARRLERLRPGLRVLFMSGHARPALAAHGTLEPGIRLVEKPFTPDALLEAVADTLSAPPGGIGR